MAETKKQYKQIGDKKIEIKNVKTDNEFDFLKSYKLPLPSKGFLYESITKDKDLLNGYIWIKPMTTVEEKILATKQFMKDGTSFERVLDSCIMSDIKAEDLLAFDSVYLLFWLRSITHGDEYNFDITCEECGKKFKYVVKISDLIFNELEDKFTEPIVIKLPNCDYEVHCELARNYTAKKIKVLQDKRNKLNKKKNTNNMMDETLLDKLLVTTISIYDSNGEEVPRSKWRLFYNSLIAGDAAEIRDKTNFSSGIDELEDIVCIHCGAEQDIVIPIGENFFRF